MHEALGEVRKPSFPTFSTDMAIWLPYTYPSIVHFPRYGHQTFVFGHYHIVDYGDKSKYSNREVPPLRVGPGL